MEKLKRFALRHFEVVLILVIVGAVAVIDRFVDQKITFLNLYFIPVLLAGYLRGQRMALATAVLCIAAVFYCQVYPSQGSEDRLLGYSLGAKEFLEDAEQLDTVLTTTSPLLIRQKHGEKKDGTAKVRTVKMHREYGEQTTSAKRRELLLGKLRKRVYVHLATWGAFLCLSGVLVGALSEERARRMRDLHGAYVGALEILTKYLASADKYMRGHLVRVSESATRIAQKLDMDSSALEYVQAAAMLHDITTIDVSMDLIERAAEISTREEEILEFEMQPEVEALAQTGSVLSGTISLVVAKDILREKAAEGKPLPAGAQIVEVANAFDSLTTEENKTPEEAFEQIEKDLPRIDEKVLMAAREVLLASKPAEE